MDKTQPERQRRYRAKLYSERGRIPELEARIRELEAALTATPPRAEPLPSAPQGRDFTLASDAGEDRLESIHPEPPDSLWPGTGEGVAIIGGLRFGFGYTEQGQTYEKRLDWPRVITPHKTNIFPLDFTEVFREAHSRIQTLLDNSNFAWERLSDGEQAKRRAWLAAQAKAEAARAERLRSGKKTAAKKTAAEGAALSAARYAAMADARRGESAAEQPQADRIEGFNGNAKTSYGGDAIVGGARFSWRLSQAHEKLLGDGLSIRPESKPSGRLNKRERECAESVRPRVRELVMARMVQRRGKREKAA